MTQSSHGPTRRSAQTSRFPSRCSWRAGRAASGGPPRVDRLGRPAGRRQHRQHGWQLAGCRRWDEGNAASAAASTCHPACLLLCVPAGGPRLQLHLGAGAARAGEQQPPRWQPRCDTSHGRRRRPPRRRPPQPLQACLWRCAVPSLLAAVMPGSPPCWLPFTDLPLPGPCAARPGCRIALRPTGAGRRRAARRL